MRTHIHGDAEFRSASGRAGPACIGGERITAAAVPAAQFVVSAAVMGVIERRVDAKGGSQRLGGGESMGEEIKHPVHVPFADDQVERPAERVVIGNAAHPDAFAPVTRVAQERFDAAIALLLVFTKHQAGKELRQREVLTTELVAEPRQHE